MVPARELESGMLLKNAVEKSPVSSCAMQRGVILLRPSAVRVSTCFFKRFFLISSRLSPLTTPVTEDAELVSLVVAFF